MAKVEGNRDVQRSSSWIRRLCCYVLQTGEIPRHVAIIMDGNRRFARKMRQEKSFGHMLGFEKLTETLEWCLDLGISEVTVYAFSIENFKRSKDEVDGLMELAKQKIARLLEESDLLERHGVCIRVLGDLNLLSRDVQEAVAKTVKLTQKNNTLYLNVCFSYTSRHEITEAIKSLTQGAADGMIYPSDVSDELLERCLYTEDSLPPDLLIRTSGEVRLSDFLLWQSSYSCLCFQNVLWPEFSIWNLFSAVLTYQKNYNAIQEARKHMYEERQKRLHTSDRQCVIKHMDDAEKSGVNEAEITERIRIYAAERERRIQSFVDFVRTERQKFLDSLCPEICV